MAYNVTCKPTLKKTELSISRFKKSSSFVVREQRIDYVVLILLVLPSLVWIFLYRTLWSSDEALYGLAAMELYHALWHGNVSNWWAAMLSVSPKPPLLPWMAQFLVPVGRMMGDVDDGLLLVTFLASLAAVIFLYEALRICFESRSTAIVGCLALAAAPMYIDIGRTFYVQSLQLTAVAWFIYIMARSKDWDSTTISLHLVAAGTFAVLAMLSSPVMCVVPVLVAGAHILKKGKAGWRFSKKHFPSVALASLLAFGAGAWYAQNLAAAMSYGAWGYGYIFGDVAGDAFLAKFTAWTDFLLRGFVMWPELMVVLALIVGWAFLARSNVTAATGIGHRTLVSFALVQVLLVIVVFASSAHQTYRYVLPLMAYLAFAIGWCIFRINKWWISTAIAAVFAVQLIAANLHFFAVTGTPPSQVSSKRSFELLEAIAELPADAGDEPIILATGALNLYRFNVEYYALHRVDDFSNRRYYDSVEFMLTGSPGERQVGQDVEAVWEQIVSANPPYVVVASEEIRQQQLRDSADGGWGRIVRGTDEISRRVAKSGIFQRIGLPGHPEIEIYRPVNRRGTVSLSVRPVIEVWAQSRSANER